MSTAVPFAQQTVTFLTREVTGRDAHGNDVYGTTRTTVDNVLVEPWHTVERFDASDVTTTRLRLYAPPNVGVDLTAIDAVEYLGHRYELDGDPMQWPDWSGGIHHTEAILKKIAG